MSALSGWNAILFDLDGTLIDSGADIAAAANRALRELHRPELPEAVIRGFVGDGVRNLMLRCLGGDEELIAEAVRQYESAYGECVLDRTVLYPGIATLLQTLEGRPLAVISNKPEAHCRHILEGLGVARCFGVIAGGDTFPEKKPSPVPLLGALGRLRAGPESALMVGDGPQDLRAARAAGIRACAVLWGFTRRDRLLAERPEFIAHSPDELRGLLAS